MAGCHLRHAEGLLDRGFRLLLFVPSSSLSRDISDILVPVILHIRSDH